MVKIVNYKFNNNYNRFHDDEDDYVDKQYTEPLYNNNYKTTESYFNTQRPSYNYYQQPYYSTTTKSPYNFNHYNYQQTTKNPYDDNNNQYSITPNYYYSSSPPQTTTTTTTSKPPIIQSTLNPYIGNYYFLKQQTTINPYNFANFGKSAYTSPSSLGEINNNHLKRSYVAASYFVDSSHIRNITTSLNQRRT